MFITSLLPAKRIFTNVDISSKKRLLEYIAENAAEVLKLPQNVIYNALLERERLGSTGLGHGIAVPHARLDNLAEAHACLVKLNTPINYDSIDKQAVDLIFVLFIPEQSTEEHLQILASLARIFSQQPVTEKIRASLNADEIIQHIKQAEMDNKTS